MEKVTLLCVAALLAAASSAAAAAWLAARLRSVEARMREVEEELESLDEASRGVEEALSSALRGLESEEALRRLRAKRRRRYIAFYVVWEEGQPPGPEEVEAAIVEALSRLGGSLAVARSAVQLVYYEQRRGAGVLRVGHEDKHLVLAAMGLVRNISGRRALIIPVRTSGTIRRAKRALGIKP